MTRKHSIARVLTLAASLLVAGAGSGHAQGQIFVLESTAPSLRVGTAFAMDERITIPAGASVRIVTPSGRTQTIKGPYSGLATDLARGQKVNDSVMAWLKNFVQTGGSNEKTPGATRSARMPPQLPAAGFSWTTIPTTMNSTICVEKGAKLQLQRASSQAADRVTVVDLTTAERGEVEFAAGSQVAVWPAGIAPRDDRAYALLAPENRPRRQLTLRVLDSLPGEDSVLAELAARDCKYQFDAWVKEKMAGGKRKAS